MTPILHYASTVVRRQFIMNGNRGVKLKICREMEKNFEGFNKKKSCFKYYFDRYAIFNKRLSKQGGYNEGI